MGFDPECKLSSARQQKSMSWLRKPGSVAGKPALTQKTDEDKPPERYHTQFGSVFSPIPLLASTELL